MLLQEHNNTSRREQNEIEKMHRQKSYEMKRNLRIIFVIRKMQNSFVFVFSFVFLKGF